MKEQAQPSSRGLDAITNNKEMASQVILLTNMVGPGEVDDMLQEETADECSKYGKVERCLIFEVSQSSSLLLRQTVHSQRYRFLEERLQMIAPFVSLSNSRKQGLRRELLMT